MSALTTIPDTDIDADSPVTVALMTALRNNGMLGNLIAVTNIASSGTHNCDADCRGTIALLWGGGGAGGGVTNSSNAAGDGGGAGEFTVSYATRTGSDALTVSIGAGGTGVSGATGNAGGSTSVTGHTTAAGGLGGRVDYYPSPIHGKKGETGRLIGGAYRGTSGNGNAAAANSGAGGGGARVTLSGGPYAGGAGGSGYAIILEFSGV